MSARETPSPEHQAFLDRRRDRIQAFRENLDQLFPATREMVLEIGCGHGHYLAAYAGQYPDASCLGVDLVTKRIGLAKRKAEKRRLANLHFLKADIRELLEAWPERLLLGRIFILFPDPWPKKRHIKNRIIQPALLDDLARHSRPGTALHFRTDHPDYFAWAEHIITTNPRWVPAPDAAWPFENPTYFQEIFGIHRSLTAVFR